MSEKKAEITASKKTYCQKQNYLNKVNVFCFLFATLTFFLSLSYFCLLFNKLCLFLLAQIFHSPAGKVNFS